MSSTLPRLFASFGALTLLLVAAAVAWSTRSQPWVALLGVVSLGSAGGACLRLVRGDSMLRPGPGRTRLAGLLAASLVAATAAALT